MNSKREALLLIGNEKIKSAIPIELSTSSLFTNKQQYPITMIHQEIEGNILLSNTTTPNQSATAKKKSKTSSQKTFFPQKWPVQKANMSPFSFSKYSRFQPIIRRFWYYVDNDNNIQGPYSSLEMDNWYRKNLLNNDLLISYKSLEITAFIRLSDIMIKTKCDPYLLQIYKRSKSQQKQSIPGWITPESKDSTDVSNNTNSCQKIKQSIWGQDALFNDYSW